MFRTLVWRARAEDQSRSHRVQCSARHPATSQRALSASTPALRVSPLRLGDGDVFAVLLDLAMTLSTAFAAAHGIRSASTIAISLAEIGFPGCRGCGHRPIISVGVGRPYRS